MTYSLSKSLMHDIGITLAGRISHSDHTDAPANDGSVKCHHCDARMQLKGMRLHVARHILNKTLRTAHTVATCGFCGRTSCRRSSCRRSSCTSKLVQSSSRGREKYYKVESDCTFKVLPKKQLYTFSQRTKCTNMVMNCTICMLSVWKYNFHLHMLEKHPAEEVPSDTVICEKEKKYISSKK